MAVDFSGQFSALSSNAGTRLNSEEQVHESRAFDAVLFDFLKVPPEQYAFQLSILDMAPFKNIQPEELSSCGWTGQRRTELSPNVVAMIRRFNQTSFWVQREVLSAEKVRTRADVVTHFIKVARRLHDLKNLHSLKAVVSALQATPIFRLQQTWQFVPRRDRDKLDELAKLVSEDDNYGNLRRYLESVRLPCLPYLGLYLTDIVFIDVAHPHSGGLESHDRKLKMNNILRVIAEFQRSTYDHLQPSEHICEYLLSNRFIEELQKFVEDDYYKMSLKLEPPENNSSNGNNACLAPSSSSPLNGGPPLVEPTLVSTAVVPTAADPVMHNSSQLNDSTYHRCLRSSFSTVDRTGGTTASYNHNECHCPLPQEKYDSKDSSGKITQHKKNQHSIAGISGFNEEKSTHKKGHSRHGSSVTTARASSALGSSKNKGTALFSACISSGEVPAKNGDFDEIGIYTSDMNEMSHRVSRSESESSGNNVYDSSTANHSIQSSPTNRSSERTIDVSSQNNGDCSPSVKSVTNRSTPVSSRDTAGSSQTNSSLDALNALGLTTEEVIAEGPLLKKTLLRNGHRPTVARWQPFWAVLYAPGSLLLYGPRRRLFSRLSQPSASVSSPIQPHSNVVTSSRNLMPTSFSASGSSSWNDTSISSSTIQKETSTSSSTYFYSGGLKKWLSCSSNFELARSPAKVINLSGWMALPCTKPRKPDLFLLQEPSRGTIYKMRGGSQAAALEWSQRLREAIRKSSTVNLMSFE